MKQKLEEDQGDSCSRLVGQELVQGRTGTGPRSPHSWQQSGAGTGFWTLEWIVLAAVQLSMWMEALLSFSLGCVICISVCVCAHMCIDISCVSASNSYQLHKTQRKEIL